MLACLQKLEVALYVWVFPWRCKIKACVFNQSEKIVCEFLPNQNLCLYFNPIRFVVVEYIKRVLRDMRLQPRDCNDRYQYYEWLSRWRKCVTFILTLIMYYKSNLFRETSTESMCVSQNLTQLNDARVGCHSQQVAHFVVGIPDILARCVTARNVTPGGGVRDRI